MNWDRRKKPSLTAPAAVSAELPKDYLKLVETTLLTALDPGLKEIQKIHPEARFNANGALYGDEVLLAITLSHGGTNLVATTVYASADVNPALPKPTIEETLSACLDAIGSIFDFYLDLKNSDRISQILHHSLSALEEAPFEWTAVSHEIEDQIPVWVRMDKLNPLLEDLTERWLRENDPEYLTRSKADVIEKESEEFLEERLEAIKKAQSGSGGGLSGGGSGPITH